MTELWGLLMVCAGSALVAFMTTPYLIRTAHQSGWLDQPDLRKRHAIPTPPIGGIVLALIVILTLSLLAFLPTLFTSFLTAGKSGLSGMQIASIALSSTVMLVIGVWDDRRSLPSSVKLLAQIFAGLMLYGGGFRIDPLELPFLGILSLGPWSVVVTVGWVVVLTNAINLIDGLDGLACGVSLPAAMALAAIGLRHGSGVSALLAAMMAGFLVAFLYFNRHPARAFLGNSGAYLIGLIFAVISLVLPLKSYTATALFLPLIVLGVPIIETITSITRRMASGQPIWQADRQHLFHLLTRSGLSAKHTVRIFWLVSALFSVFALLASTLDRTTLLAALGLFLVVIWLGFFMFTHQRLGRRRTTRMRGSKSRTT